jgi:3'(2'), 5'-bisphosphate nucleotidase
MTRRAGALIMDLYGGSAAAARKGDGSPVTAADQAAHTSLVGDLTAWTPDIPIVSEEGHVPSFPLRAAWKQFWLVDPLDGTREFLTQNGEFTVNVALIEGREPILGVVYAPALNLLYVAGRGLGAWKREGALPAVRLASAPRPPGTPLVVAESRSHPSPALEEYLRSVNVSRRVQAGSSLKFCWVAEGKADIYPRFGTTMEWDTAAGDCIYRYSGRDGPRRSSLVYNTADLRNDHFVVGE